jgi:serine/threonine-protein kinase
MRNEPLPELPKNSKMQMLKIGLGAGAAAGALLASFITALICS